NSSVNPLPNVQNSSVNPLNQSVIRTDSIIQSTNKNRQTRLTDIYHYEEPRVITPITNNLINSSSSQSNNINMFEYLLQNNVQEIEIEEISFDKIKNIHIVYKK
ncbi:3169_t:CDS:1, partial [Cetraspora pellucida]